MKKIFLIIILIILAVVAWCGYVIYVPNNFTTIAINVESGANVKKIAQALKAKGIIKSESAFIWYSRLTGADSKLVIGIHQLESGASSKQIIKQLETKIAYQEKSITIIEGWKLSDIAAYLETSGVVSSADFLAAAKIDNWRDQYDFLADRKITSLEGFIFPDTYRIYDDATAKDVIKKTLDNFNNKLTSQLLSDIDKSGHSLLQIVTMASIIEREALYDEDRAMIADIFWKRIEAGIGLQSDATVNYVTGKKTSRPSYADLQVDSPYNTYKYRGLTPGPISNPGMASIKAAIYPTDNPYCYFLTDDTGRAHFGKTYADHQANIVKYLK